MTLSSLLLASAPLSADGRMELPFPHFPAPESEPVSFTNLLLSSAIEETLFHQWDIYLSDIRVKENEGLYLESQGPFDPFFTLGGSQNWGQNNTTQLGLDIPQGTTFTFPIVGTVESDGPGGIGVNTRTTQANLGLNKKLRIGTEFAFITDVKKEKNPFFLLNEEYLPGIQALQVDYIRQETTTVSFKVNQPLLKNFIHGEEAETERSKKLLLESSKRELVYNVSQSVLKTVLAYWDLVKSKNILKARIKAEHESQRYADIISEYIKKEQYAKADLTQPLRLLENSKANVTMAQQRMIENSQKLVFAMGVDTDPGTMCSLGYGIEEFPHHSFWEDTCCITRARDAVHKALMARADLSAFKLKSKAKEAEMLGAKNGALPDLSMSLEGKATNTTYENKAKTFFDGYAMGHPQKEMVLTVNFSVPIFRSKGRGQYRAAKAAKQQSDVQIDRLVGKISKGVMERLTNHLSLIKQAKESKLAFFEAKKYVQQQQTLLKAGMTSIFQLIDSHTKMVTEEVRFIEAQAEYYTNLAYLYHELGMLIEEDSQLTQLQIGDITALPEFLRY